MPSEMRAKKKWILCGKNDAATACLEHLIEQGDDVWVLPVAGDDGRDGWQRSLRARAEAFGFRMEQPRRINAPEVVERLAAYGADALISIQYDQILKDPLFDAIGCPALNFHFALLPRHRGMSTIAWALLEGDPECGVTLHHMVEAIDAGDIVAQRAVAIGAEDTARAVYDKVSRATIELFRQSYPFAAELLQRRQLQDATRVSYHRGGDIDFSVRRITWDQPAATLHRWIRAMIFPPMQYPETFLHGRRLHVASVAADTGGPVSAAPGTVVACSPDGVVVAARDRTITLRELLPADPLQPGGGGAKLEIEVGDLLD